MQSLLIIFFLFFYSLNNFVFADSSEEYNNIKDINLSILDKSALDFTSLVEPGPAGKWGKLIVSSEGKFVFEKKTDRPQRFLAASISWSKAHGGIPDHDTATKYARQLKMHGYNLARFHYVDAHLMTGRVKDFDFDPEQLDRLFYFLAALKKEGIYWIVEGMTSDNGAYGMQESNRWVNKFNLKQRLYFDDSAKQHWEQLVKLLWGRENPYTGISTLQDPALIGFITVNEGGLSFLTRQNVSPELAKEYKSWLKDKYQTVSNLKRAWSVTLDANQQFEDIKPPDNVKAKSTQMKDFQLFMVEKEIDQTEWMKSTLKGLGYDGIVSGLNNWISLASSKGRSRYDWTDMHAYHDEVFSYKPGGKIKQTSSLAEGVNYVRGLASSREVGKPFTVSEYGQPFWNKYRHESGLVFPAVAAIQGWDMICQHAEGPIDLKYENNAPRRDAIYPYNLGYDPVLRAGETLAALLFLRGDVSEGKSTLVVDLDEEKWIGPQSVNYMPSDISYLSFLARLGIQFSEKNQIKNSFSIKLNDSFLTKVTDKLTTISGIKLIGKFKERVNQLIKSHILPKSIVGELEKDVAVSDSGEVKYDLANNRFSVVTSKTVASIVDQKQQVQLGLFLISGATSPAMIAVSAVDDKQLADSGKLLLIVSTDAQNSDMEFEDSDQKVLSKIGHLPVKIMRASFNLKFKTNKNWKLNRLGLDGSVKESLTLSPGSTGEVNTDIDNYSATFGPTTYFSLTAT